MSKMLFLLMFRFCSECKSKVLKAYSILTGDVDGDAEKGCVFLIKRRSLLTNSFCSILDAQ